MTLIDFASEEVLFIHLTDEMVDERVNKYDNDSEAWINSIDLPYELGIDVDNSNFIVTDDEPEIYDCRPTKDGYRKTRIYPTTPKKD